MNPDHYAVLGVDPEVDAATLRTAYRELARRWHPDRRPDDPDAAATFRRIQEAYEVLSDPEKRRAYDAGQDSSESPGAPDDLDEDDLWQDDWDSEPADPGPARRSGGRIPVVDERRDPRDGGVPQWGRPGFWDADEIPQSGRPGFWDQ